jgi:quinol monooxygenase YgiN
MAMRADWLYLQSCSPESGLNIEKVDTLDTTKEFSMGRIVISAYQPKPGKLEALRALMKAHLPTLRSQNLVTERDPIVMESAEGTIIEVFEWKSREAIDSAHSNPEVLKMWEAYAEICDFVPISNIDESNEVFSEFTPLL